jgi:hypothetical protein
MTLARRNGGVAAQRRVAADLTRGRIEDIDIAAAVGRQLGFAADPVVYGLDTCAVRHSLYL